MEEFKSLENLLSPDERNTFWSVLDEESGEMRSISLEEIYQSISHVSLDAVVPEDVRSQFNVAKNLAAYSWYCYPFHQVCEMKAYSTVEYALKQRLEHHWPFPKLIKKSISWGLIKDIGFCHLKKPLDESSTEYSKSLIEIMPGLRNGLAHGGTTLHPGSISTLRFCADFINQLYRNEINKPSREIKEWHGGSTKA